MRQNNSMSKRVQGPDKQKDPRMSQAATWAAGTLGLAKVELEPVSGDASFRRYFRFCTGDRSIILMDAPPEKETSVSYVDIDRRLREAGLNAPEILHFDLDLGFGLLEDFGDTLYRDILDEQSVDELFPPLFTTLANMARNVSSSKLPGYDALLLQQEMELFPDWYLRVHKKRPFTSTERLLWNEICARLIHSAYEQPQVFVHKDFHSCNILRTDTGEPGIIDFQDGVSGPLSYDFVSLLWDRYIAWPRECLESWMKDFHGQLEPDCSLETWIRWCDLMSVQRNLKIVGIFARLKYRDGKEAYLDMIPRFYGYLLEVIPRYPEFHEFHELLGQAECAP
jgi:aminoglycoside/choline kinase family phosphotransferase